VHPSFQSSGFDPELLDDGFPSRRASLLLNGKVLPYPRLYSMFIQIIEVVPGIVSPVCIDGIPPFFSLFFLELAGKEDACARYLYLLSRPESNNNLHAIPSLFPSCLDLSLPVLPLFP
jgi:hypothetical protein